MRGRFFSFLFLSLLMYCLMMGCCFAYIVKERITATTNIAKITKSMKMVSASKLRGDQNRLAAGKPFAVSAT
jgi:hypothetical protein